MRAGNHRASDREAPSFFETEVLVVTSDVSSWVEHIWINRATASSMAHRFYRAPELVTHLAIVVSPHAAAPGGHGKRVRVVASGLQTRLYPVPFPASLAIIFQLRPGAGRALGLPMKALANQEVEIDELSVPWGRELTERVAGMANAEQRVSVLSEVLSRELRRADDGARVVRRAGAFAAVCRACGRTEDLARRIGYSERHLRRTFLDLFGVNPKDVSSAARMNAVLNAMSPSPDWAEAALRHGYYDQSHLISDFHRLVGNTPQRFTKTLASPTLVGGAIVVRNDAVS